MGRSRDRGGDPLTEARFAEIVEDIATRRDESGTDPVAAAEHGKEGKGLDG